METMAQTGNYDVSCQTDAQCQYIPPMGTYQCNKYRGYCVKKADVAEEIANNLASGYTKSYWSEQDDQYSSEEDKQEMAQMAVDHPSCVNKIVADNRMTNNGSSKCFDATYTCNSCCKNNTTLTGKGCFGDNYKRSDCCPNE